MRLLALVTVGLLSIGLLSCSSDETMMANDPGEALVADWEYFIFPGLGEEERTEALVSVPGHVAALILNQRTSATIKEGERDLTDTEIRTLNSLVVGFSSLEKRYEDPTAPENGRDLVLKLYTESGEQSVIIYPAENRKLPDYLLSLIEVLETVVQSTLE